MIRYTLDTNCLIDLERGSGFAASIRSLVDAHGAGIAEVAIPAVAASERQRGGQYLDQFDRFMERLHTAGLDHLPLIEPIAIFGVGFYGKGYFADEAMVELENKIHAVLHPTVERSLSAYRSANGYPLDDPTMPPKWRNALCDVQIAWSHIYHQRDCLVTSDGNFFKATKHAALLALGARSVMRPAESVALLGGAA